MNIALGLMVVLGLGAALFYFRSERTITEKNQARIAAQNRYQSASDRRTTQAEADSMANAQRKKRSPTFGRR